jgi:hypothetical protein
MDLMIFILRNKLTSTEHFGTSSMVAFLELLAYYNEPKDHSKSVPQISPAISIPV